MYLECYLLCGIASFTWLNDLGTSWLVNIIPPYTPILASLHHSNFFVGKNDVYLSFSCHLQKVYYLLCLVSLSSSCLTRPSHHWLIAVEESLLSKTEKFDQMTNKIRGPKSSQKKNSPFLLCGKQALVHFGTCHSCTPAFVENTVTHKTFSTAHRVTICLLCNTSFALRVCTLHSATFCLLKYLLMKTFPGSNLNDTNATL